MALFDVYNQYPIELVSARGMRLKDSKGSDYLDFYGDRCDTDPQCRPSGEARQWRHLDRRRHATGWRRQGRFVPEGTSQRA